MHSVFNVGRHCMISPAIRKIEKGKVCAHIWQNFVLPMA